MQAEKDRSGEWIRHILSKAAESSAGSDSNGYVEASDLVVAGDVGGGSGLIHSNGPSVRLKYPVPEMS